MRMQLEGFFFFYIEEGKEGKAIKHKNTQARRYAGTDRVIASIPMVWTILDDPDLPQRTAKQGLLPWEASKCTISSKAHKRLINKQI